MKTIRFIIPRNVRRFFSLLITGRVIESSPCILDQDDKLAIARFQNLEYYGDIESFILEDTWDYHPLIILENIVTFWQDFQDFRQGRKELEQIMIEALGDGTNHNLPDLKSNSLDKYLEDEGYCIESITFIDPSEYDDFDGSDE
jgi:hypothetical protein